MTKERLKTLTYGALCFAPANKTGKYKQQLSGEESITIINPKGKVTEIATSMQDKDKVIKLDTGVGQSVDSRQDELISQVGKCIHRL